VIRLGVWWLRLVFGLRRRVARRLTRAGLLALGVLAVSAALGVDTGLTLAYQIFAFTLAALLLAGARALRLRGRLRAKRVLPPFATAGEAVRYTIIVSNDGDRSQAGLNIIDELADPRPGVAEVAARRGTVLRRWRELLALHPVRWPAGAPVPELAASGDAVVRLELLPARRGVIRFTSIAIWRPDPLGLVRALRTLPAPASLLVLPARYAVPPLRLPGQRTYQPGGVTLASSVGDSEEFQGLRDYRPGDPLQRIHWKSFARAGRPVVKEYESEFFERHALVLDTFTAVEDEVLEEAVAIAASFCCTLETHESLLDLMFVGDRSYRYTAGRGQLQVDRLLEVLAHVRVCADRPLNVLRTTLLEHRDRLSSAILVLLAWDAHGTPMPGRVPTWTGPGRNWIPRRPRGWPRRATRRRRGGHCWTCLPSRSTASAPGQAVMRGSRRGSSRLPPWSCWCWQPAGCDAALAWLRSQPRARRPRVRQRGSTRSS